MTPPATLDAWAADAAPASDKLDRLRQGAARLRETTLTLADLEEKVKEVKRRLNDMKARELPDLFAEAGVESVGLGADGNLPAVEVKLVPFYNASIPEEKRPPAHAWLRDNGHGGIVKSEFKVYFGKGQDHAAKGFLAYVRQNDYDYEQKEAVHASTLTAFVRSEVEAGRSVPLDLLGATVGTVAKLTEKKTR